MPKTISFAWVCLLLALSGAASGQAWTPSEINRAEQIGWHDPDAALLLLDKLQPTVRTDDALVELLTVRGFAYVDGRQDKETQAVIQRLEFLARRGVVPAMLATHLVRAYFLCASDQFNAAKAEIDAIDSRTVRSQLDEYRVELLRASVLRFFGQHEAALQAYERGLDIANAMPSTPYALHAILRSTQFFARIGNLDRASTRLVQARRLAEQSGDEAALVRIALDEADVAYRRDDREANRRLMLEALQHAEKVGSARLLAPTYVDLGDSYSKTGDYETSLSYSRRALALAPKLRLNGFEQTARFNMGIAEIGLRNLTEGQRLAERAIQDALDSGNLIDAQSFMAEYGVALERAGAWRSAVHLYHRADKLRERLMTTERQRALLQLSAQFDAERRTREIEILKRGNAIQKAELRAQRLRQLFVITVTALVALICVLLGWSFNRVRKMNAQLRYKSEHDALTGLCNRRYLQDHVLASWGERAFQGSLIIVDVDHFKQINDSFGHTAGDMVLARIGKRLAQSLRKHDVLVRWGGEEFLVVLEPLSEAHLRAIAGKLLNAIRHETLAWHGETIHCTASIGYASFPLSGTQTDVSISRAVSLVDKALYQAKQRGRDRACFISALRAGSEQDLLSISEDFDMAAADERVQLLELTG